MIKNDRSRVQVVFKKPSLTQQQFKESTNIDYLMKVYSRSGQSPFRSVEQCGGKFGDFSDLPHYQEVLNRVKLAENEFYKLDADSRKKYDNDVEVYINSLTQENLRGAQQDAPATHDVQAAGVALVNST